MSYVAAVEPAKDAAGNIDNQFCLTYIIHIDNLIWACGGMVDTLVLGTSAQAWEFESLHAQLLFLC